jgi:L,D-peptidoglycan transpeptidase YkuD (ErfK/YbiS/YcfS/YnhG family)
MRRYFFALLTCFIAVLAQAQTPLQFNSSLRSSNQVLLVKLPSYTAIQGRMFLYERKNKRAHWKLIDSFAVTVGRSGLAKDPQTTLSFDASVPVKHEGDGKSPAGIFLLGPVFSYHELNNLRMPFVRVDTTDLCVDDAKSSYYNTLVLSDTAKPNFDSFEYMKRQDSLYEYGVWVKYNSDPATPGNGSCIFLHVWRNESSATSGCTAMSRDNILKLIHWLDKKKNPQLLQIKETE